MGVCPFVNAVFYSGWLILLHANDTLIMEVYSGEFAKVQTLHSPRVAFRCNKRFLHVLHSKRSSLHFQQQYAMLT